MPETNVTLKHNPMPTLGVSNYTIFKMLTDDAKTGEATYDEAIRIPGTVEIAPTDNGATDTLDADNKAYYTESYIEKLGHEITNADIPPEIDALMRGLDTVDGGVEYKGIIEAPNFGVAWEVMKPGSVSRFIRYYKGKFGFASNVGGKTKPSEGASEKQTAKATYTATLRECDEKGYYVLDSDSDTVKDMTLAQIREKWFSDINWYPSSTPIVSEGE